MQNRFTAKDFFYMLIGLTACLLLFLNMWKTQHEVDAISKVESTLKSQNATLASLEKAIGQIQRGSGNVTIDAETLAALRSGSGLDVTPRNNTASSTGLDTASGEFVANAATLPSYTPAADIRFSGYSSRVNRRGLAQSWQAAPDAELPDDFAPGDSLIMTWTSDPQTLTPLVASDAYGTRVFWEVMETLVNLDVDAPFPYVPGLARSWEVSDDGMEITFHLFENATFSDGVPVTADDVIFSWDLAMNEKVDCPQERSYIEENVQKWEKLGTHTVKFTMKKPYFDAVGVCGNLLFIMPEHIYGQYDEETINTGIQDVCVGSGPFVLERWVRNDRIVLARNENYWGPKPGIDSMVIRIISNELTNLQEYKAGNVDLIAPSSDQWEAEADTPEIQQRGQTIIYYTPRNGYQYIGYNQRRPIFQDKRTRQALTMLLDRRLIIDTIAYGLGIETTGAFFPMSDQCDTSIEPWPYDVDAARAKLKEVGWEDTNNDGIIDKDLDGDGKRDPFEFTFMCPVGSSFYPPLQRYVQQQFAQAGIKVNLDLLEWSVFVERLNERQFDCVSLLWTGSPEGDPYQIWHSSQIEGRGSNFTAFNNAEADRIIEQARETIDYDERMKLWHRFHQILHEEQPYTFLLAGPARGFLDGRFKNVQKHDYRLLYQEFYVPAEDQKR
ncbi:MAG: ABC transporter substrate-binding protein [Phycisphaerales bacterium]